MQYQTESRTSRSIAAVNIPNSKTEFVKNLSCFTSDNKARRKKDINKPKPFDAKAKDLRTKK
jgi:hypothetical protein